MISRNINVARVSLALLSLAAGFAQQPGVTANLLGLGSAVGGLAGAVTGSLAGSANGFAQSSASASSSSGGMIPNIMNGVGGMMGGVNSMVGGIGNTVGGLGNTVGGMVGSMTGGLMGQGGLVGGAMSSAMGGISGLAGGEGGLIGNHLRLATGAVDGITSGLGAGLSGLERANGIGAPMGMNPSLATGLGLRNNFKRAALADSMMANSVAGSVASSVAGNEILGNAVASEAGAVVGEAAGLGAMGSDVAAGAVAGAAAAGGALAAADAVASSGAVAGGIAGGIMGREALAMDAMRNAQAESALAGSQMAAHGANNAQSASLASNAYRQAKLASARDRVNIPGTIQNSARISDAAIATHDAATKAEDSLLGSELAVDSAATVLDSDAAYIPPVTSSLLRSLPYGRLGIRNIIPKPLTYPSGYLPDVWLNGKPVNYLNVPLKMYPYGLGPYGAYSTLNGAVGLYNGQPFMSNNGLFLNGMVYDPAFAYMIGANVFGALGSSVVPILANGQLEAQDEVAMANFLTMQQLNGQGMLTTYGGYGRLNPVPMITGSVSDVNLMPTTTIGTTYPIGSALVIEPRDSFFQDYNDNASSRQNMDERQQ